MGDMSGKSIILLTDEVVHLFRLGDYNNGNEKLLVLLEDLMVYTNNIKGIEKGEETIIKINKVLPYLLNSMQNKDYVYMCDLLKYELRKYIV